MKGRASDAFDRLSEAEKLRRAFLSAYQLFVFGVFTDPEPDEVLLRSDRDCAMVAADTHRLIAADRLQMQ